MTGMRPGELAHLRLPDNLDLEHRLLFVRNKPKLGWQVKPRSEREIPIAQELRDVLQVVIGTRRQGPVFLRRRFANGQTPMLNAAWPLSVAGIRTCGMNASSSTKSSAVGLSRWQTPT